MQGEGLATRRATSSIPYIARCIFFCVSVNRGKKRQAKVVVKVEKKRNKHIEKS